MISLVRTPIIDIEPIEEPDAIHDPDAERAVLAAMLLDAPAAVARIGDTLVAADFHDSRHATLWECFVAIHARGEPVDIHTSLAELRARNRLNAIGGAQYLGELTDALPTLAHCAAHARLVVEASRRRRLAEIGERLGAAARSSRDPEKIRDAAVEALRAMRFGGGASASSALDLFGALLDDIASGLDGTRPRALPFGVETLDVMSCGGMKRGGAYFLAARPGIGKTALACQVAGAAAASGECVLYVALEPSRGDVMAATIANRAGVPLVKLTRAPHTLSQVDMDAATAAGNAVADWPLYVVDGNGRDVPDTVGRIEAVMRSLPTKPSLVIVDHLLKLKATRTYAKGYEGTSEVVATLVALGKRTGATVLTLCHIGRGVSTTSGLFRRPRAEDIAGGDAMNRDADGIVILHREDKYPTAKENVGSPLVAGIVDALAPKLRGVADNTFGRMRFRGDVQRFEAIEERRRDPDEDLDDPSLRSRYAEGGE